ncbi:MAG: hypothetical protein KIT63_21770 [Rhodoferax sp.]|nr:hypothetical protein [Rhodoferax sp.]
MSTTPTPAADAMPAPAGNTPAAGSGDSDANKNAWELAADLVGLVPVVGKPLSLIVRRRQGRWLLVTAMLVLVFVVLPLLLPLLAAVYINSGLLGDEGQRWYAEKVVSAFRVREAADQISKRANQRLDYFQVIEFVGNAKETRQYSLSMEPYQKARFVVERATALSTDNNCAVPLRLIRKNAELMTLSLFDRKLMPVRNSPTAASYQLSAKDWDDVKSKMDGSNRVRIALDPVDELLDQPCNGVQVDLRVSIEVFKDTLASAAPTVVLALRSASAGIGTH